MKRRAGSDKKGGCVCISDYLSCFDCRFCMYMVFIYRLWSTRHLCLQWRRRLASVGSGSVESWTSALRFKRTRRATIHVFVLICVFLIVVLIFVFLVVIHVVVVYDFLGIVRRWLWTRGIVILWLNQMILWHKLNRQHASHDLIWSMVPLWWWHLVCAICIVVGLRSVATVRRGLLLRLLVVMMVVMVVVMIVVVYMS